MPQQTLRRRAAKASSLAKRKLLGLALRLPGGASSPESLLSRFPDEALMPLRRDGLDPVPELSALQAREPVSKLKMPLGLRGWLVTGYDESRELLAADHTVYSNDFSNMVGKVGIAPEDDPGGLGFADPPAHTRLRKMLTPHFTVRALTQWRPRIQSIIDDALDGLERAGADGSPVDLQRLFALQVPSRTIMEILGVDETNRAEFERLSEIRFDFAGGAVGSLDPIQDAIELLRQVVERQRVEPQQGLISTILAEYGDDVTDIELAGLADGVLTGGLETSVSMLTLGTLALLEDRALWESVRDSDEQVDAVVEELLRYLAVVQVGFPRFAAQDTTLGGKDIFAGDVLICSLSGAGRDTRRAADLDRVDPTRETPSHLAFGHGVHRCVGAELARIELRMAYPALVRRFPDLRLATPADALEFRTESIVYGLKALPVLTHP